MLKRLGRAELIEYAREVRVSIGEQEIDQYLELTDRMSSLMDAFAAEPLPPAANIEARRDAEENRPPVFEDPLNAVVRWCSVKADVEGPLSGKRIGLKDNMAIAGVPMTYGSTVMSDYVPVRDSVVADRILRAGGEIVAVLNMDSFAWSGGGETSDYGPILNPFDLTRTASGSSGGSAAALFYDNVDITFGTDQAGSIRLPASWCGTLGLKATHGLVPYTGIAAIDHTYDHVGPLARTVEELAIGLAAVAGRDDSDPRQCGVETLDYIDAVHTAPDSLKGRTIGVLSEGFGADDPDAPLGTRESAEATRAVIENFAALGASVREVSVPEHLYGAGLMFTAIAEGQAAMMTGGGNGYHWRGRYDPDLALELGRRLAGRGHNLPPTLKMVLLLGTHFRRHYYGSLYAKAQNLTPALRAAYDRALTEVDVLALPTATHYAHIHKPDATLTERVLRGDSMIGNTGPFDATGHPALSIPAAEADGLPVGVMLVARHFGERTLIALARTYEARVGWRPPIGRLAFGRETSSSRESRSRLQKFENYKGGKQ